MMVSNSSLRSNIQTEQKPLNLVRRLLLNLFTESGFNRKFWTLEVSRENKNWEIEATHAYHPCDKINVLGLRRTRSSFVILVLLLNHLKWFPFIKTGIIPFAHKLLKV